MQEPMGFHLSKFTTRSCPGTPSPAIYLRYPRAVHPLPHNLGTGYQHGFLTCLGQVTNRDFASRPMDRRQLESEWSFQVGPVVTAMGFYKLIFEKGEGLSRTDEALEDLN